MEYWLKRLLEEQAKVADKTIEEIEQQLKKYYKHVMETTIADFEATYDKLLATATIGQAPTPADLYKLDKYWKTQAQLKTVLQELGDKQIGLLSKRFEEVYGKVYVSLALPAEELFSTINQDTARQMINQIWCADGKSWSQRVWTNTDRLQQSLNDGLIDCVVGGKKTSQLVKELRNDFQVSYHRANTIVKTEVARIQTQASKERYKSYGVQEIEIFADPDNRTCPICSGLDGKRYNINEPLPLPAHPNCRCCILPVIEVEEERIQTSTPTENNLNFAGNSGIMKNKQSIPQDVQKAIDKVKEIQNKELHFYKHTNRHQNHAEKLTGLTGEEAWKKYEEMASGFLKKEIDMADMEGFISGEGWLFKFQHSMGLFGILSDKETISTLFVPTFEECGMTPEEYWLNQTRLYRRKQDGQ